MDLIKRISIAYNKSIHINSLDSMWIHWIKPKLEDVLNNISDLDLFKFNLENPSTNYLCFGFDDMYKMNDFKNYDDVIIYNNSVKNSIIKLCASLGLIRFNNPEGGEISQSINYDLEDLLIKLDNYFGFKIDFPNIFDKSGFNWLFYVNYNKDLVDADIITEQSATDHYNNYGKNENRQINGEIGLISSRGIIKLRSAHSLHFVSRIKEVSKQYNISTILEIPEIRVYEVASFYTMYNLQPVGKYLLQFCKTTPCMLRGADELLKACENKLGIKLNQTTRFF